MRGVRWRAALIVIVIVVSAFYLVPPSERINLGLDLQGGIHLVLEVQSEKAVESKMSRYFTELRNRLSIDDIRTRTFKRDGLRLTATLHRPADRGRFLTMMQNYPTSPWREKRARRRRSYISFHHNKWSARKSRPSFRRSRRFETASISSACVSLRFSARESGASSSSFLGWKTPPGRSL